MVIPNKITILILWEKGLSRGFGRILFSDKPMWLSKIIGIGMAAGCSGRCIFWRCLHRFYAWTFGRFWTCSDDLRICLRGLWSPASRCGTAQFFVGATGYITCFIGGGNIVWTFRKIFWNRSWLLITGLLGYSKWTSAIVGMIYDDSMVYGFEYTCSIV